MRIILLKDVRGVGRQYEEKEVKDGYARNFLFPRGLAKKADKSALKIKQAHEAELRMAKKKLEEEAEKISKLELEFSIKVGAHGEVFGGVSKHDISQSLWRNHKIKDVEIAIEHPLKSIGTHPLEVRFKQGIKATLAIKIIPAQ